MAITTFAELKTIIAGTLMRNDLDSVIPGFIASAEAKMNRVLRVEDMVTRNAAYSISSAFTALPAGFRQAKTLRLTSISPTKPLTFRTPADAQRLLEQCGDVTGVPDWYTIVGGNLQVVRPPGSTYTAELTYYGSLTPLSDSATSNWLLSKHPDAYLYGSLVHSAPYLKDDERIPIWAGLFDSIIQDIRVEDEGYSIGGNAPQSFGRAIG